MPVDQPAVDWSRCAQKIVAVVRNSASDASVGAERSDAVQLRIGSDCLVAIFGFDDATLKTRKYRDVSAGLTRPAHEGADDDNGEKSEITHGVVEEDIEFESDS